MKLNDRHKNLIKILLLILLFSLFTRTSPFEMCRRTMALCGPGGMAIWLLLYADIILTACFALAIAIQVIIQIRKYIWIVAILCVMTAIELSGLLGRGRPIFDSHSAECLNVIEDIVHGPVEVTVESYNLHHLQYETYRHDGHSSAPFLCYQIDIESSQGVDRIVFPMKTFERRSTIYAENQLPFKVMVYPKTGILADSDSLDIIRNSVKPE